MLVLKVLAGTLAFVGVLWAIRSVNPRAVGMTMTFPALNGLVLLTVTDKIIGEMVIGIVPMMVFNGFLPTIFLRLRARHGERAALASCLLIWVGLAALLELEVLQLYRRSFAALGAILGMACATWAFQRLRAVDLPEPRHIAASLTGRDFIRDRMPRILLFFVSLSLVSVLAYVLRDAHSLVGRLSALPLVPLFVLHWAVSQRRVDLAELRLSALIGPVAAGVFLFVYALSLGLVRDDSGDLHRYYWPVAILALLAAWELTRRLILSLARATYRA